MKDEIFKKIQVIFRTVFEDPNLVLNENLKADDIEMWDSLTHMDLIDSIEKEFNFKIPFEKVILFETSGDLIEYVNQTTTNT